MPTKIEALAAAIRGTMPVEPTSPPPFNLTADPLLRLYSDTMAAALLGPLPAPATPPGVPGAMTVAYPTPLVPPSAGPHIAACSTGASLPSTGDAVKGQIHVKDNGDVHIFTGSVWKQMTLV